MKKDKMKIYDLTASIVLFKSNPEEVINVLEEFLKTPLKCKLFLIDNSPTADLNQYFKNYPVSKVEYMFMGRNSGFGTGHNVAIDRALDLSDYHVVLNSDIKFSSKILLMMRNYMIKNRDVGLLAPKILNFDGSLQYSAKLLPSPVNLIVRRFIPVNFIQQKLDYRYEFRFWSFDKIVNVPYVMGCFMFMSTKALKKVGGFDERFFMYPEDIDLTRRIHQYFKTLYFPGAEIYHKHGKGSYKNLKLLYYHTTSMIKYFNKWGWIFDQSRRRINKSTLEQLK
tara:strand:- start:196684 stop:197526 length:843 start_codon:yes stop_codon:yes gene_type:complete